MPRQQYLALCKWQRVLLHHQLVKVQSDLWSIHLHELYIDKSHEKALYCCEVPHPRSRDMSQKRKATSPRCKLYQCHHASDFELRDEFGLL